MKIKINIPTRFSCIKFQCINTRVCEQSTKRIRPPSRCFRIREINIRSLAVPPSRVNIISCIFYKVSFILGYFMLIAIQIYKRVCPQRNFETIQILNTENILKRQIINIKKIYGYNMCTNNICLYWYTQRTFVVIKLQYKVNTSLTLKTKA